MAHFEVHNEESWCYLCGSQGKDNIDVKYPNNAKYGLSGPSDKSIRICRDCAKTILEL